MKVRMWGFSLDPKERFAVLLVKAYTKKLDRYEVSKPTLLRYDLAKHAVTDTIPWPRGEEREGAQILFSPKGDLMYFFTQDDVLIYDTNTLKEVDRWEISKTLFEEGLGRIDFGFPYDVYEEPGFYTGLFRTTDPVNRRTQMGVARMDLANRQLDFYSLGPSVGVSFRLSPDRKKAYGIHSEVGNYQFWTFDLDSRRVVGKTEFAGRPRMGLDRQLERQPTLHHDRRQHDRPIRDRGLPSSRPDQSRRRHDERHPRSAPADDAEITRAVAGPGSSSCARPRNAALAASRIGAGAVARQHRARALHPLPRATADRPRAARLRLARARARHQSVRGADARQLRAERRERVDLHAHVGRDPVRHAAGALSPAAATVAALLRRHAGRTDRDAAQRRHRRNPARRRRDRAGVGRQRDLPRRQRRHPVSPRSRAVSS